MLEGNHRKVGGVVLLCAATLISGCSNQIALLHPDGTVGAHEKSVILTAFGLMLIVVVPVFLMTFLFAWRYRASNKKATYQPKWDFSWKIDAIVWLVPTLIITALGVLSWKTTHALSPYRPLASSNRPVQVEAVALDWKWLFIYPKRHIATVNQLVFPVDRPVDFRLTSDTVMTSFFIPRLGSQIYAMAGMRTKLHLLADKTGTYTGRNFQFSGAGYSAMHFKAIATTPAKFQQWVRQVRQSGRTLSLAAFKKLARPSTANPVVHYAAVRPHLFDYVIHRHLTVKATVPKRDS